MARLAQLVERAAFKKDKTSHRKATGSTPVTGISFVRMASWEDDLTLDFQFTETVAVVSDGLCENFLKGRCFTKDCAQSHRIELNEGRKKEMPQSEIQLPKIKKTNGARHSNGSQRVSRHLSSTAKRTS
jgi:hypothetical protein